MHSASPITNVLSNTAGAQRKAIPNDWKRYIWQRTHEETGFSEGVDFTCRPLDRGLPTTAAQVLSNAAAVQAPAEAKKLLTDRTAYIAYLESQLERVSAACLTVQSFDERLESVTSSAHLLQEKVHPFPNPTSLYTFCLRARARNPTASHASSCLANPDI